MLPYVAGEGLNATAGFHLAFEGIEARASGGIAETIFPGSRRNRETDVC
jgi:hypothetical protein